MIKPPNYMTYRHGNDFQLLCDIDMWLTLVEIKRQTQKLCYELHTNFKTLKRSKGEYYRFISYQMGSFELKRR